MAVRLEKILTRLAAFIVLSSLLANACSGMTLSDIAPRRAPDFSAEDLDGDAVTLSSLHGRNTLLFFGATWCPHCRDVLDSLDNLSAALGDQLAVFFIAVGQDANEITDYFGDPMPIYRIVPDENGRISSLYGIEHIPTCAFIDKAGLIQHFGQFNPTTILRLMAGEKLAYPRRPYANLQAGDRIAHARGRPSGDKKRYIVELDEKPGFSKRLSESARRTRRALFRRAAQRIKGRIIHNYGSLKNKIVVEISPDNVQRLAELPRFKSFKEDRRVHALLEDSVYQIRADYAWDNAVTGQGVKVCVVDTGIDYTHPDLQGKVIAQFNADPETDDAMDDNSHGTHVAGIIASEGLKYRGVSYDVSLMAAKVLDYSGSGFSSDVILGINWCVAQGADVINLSVGEGLYSGTCDDDDMAQAVNEAVDAGVVVACAAGNDGNAARMVSPACASKAIAVGAVDKLDGIASYSDGGDELDIVAPGGEQFGGKNFAEIVSTYSTEVANNPLYCMYLISEECYDNFFVVDGTRYIRAVGTSMATPHVAAAAALLLEENPSLTPAQVKTVLELSADDLGAPGWDPTYGWGRINMQRALQNIPPEVGELVVRITEPNAADAFNVNEHFDLIAEVDCFGGDGCGNVLVYAQFCNGYDCNDLVDINSTTALSTLDNNPNNLGILSGYTVDTNIPAVFDMQTVLDISEQTYDKSLNPSTSLVGSTLPGEYNTGDLEPQDGVGAIGENVEEHYEFAIPPGSVKTIKVRLENYIVLHWVYPPFAGWYVYTSNAAGDNLHLIGDCIPPEGGGGETPPPDCWFISDDPNALADLNPGATSYIKLVSHDVDSDGFGDDFLTFNDIEVIVDYKTDPENDDLFKYYVQFDLNDVDTSAELTAARLTINVAQAAEDAVAELHLVDTKLLPGADARAVHEANAPPYSVLPNPIKTFNCAATGPVTLNVKTALEQAIAAADDAIAFQVTETDNNRLIVLDALNGDNPPVLTISQKVSQVPGQPQPGGEPSEDPNNGPRPLTYDAVIRKDVSEDSYARDDNPASAVIGAQFASQYSTGDLELEDGVGAAGENVEKHYEFEIPAGIVKTVKVRMENYLVLRFDYPPFAAWYVYTSDADGSNLNLIGDCIPVEGGGGMPQPPDCWFISSEPNVLADLTPGQTNYIKLVSHDVGDNDWIFFNDIEVIIEYAIDPNNDNISRYYLKFDISELTADVRVDSATLNLHVTEPAADSVAEISLVSSAYDPFFTTPYAMYEAEDADYTNLVNPIKTFASDTLGAKQLNVKTALEHAVENGIAEIAFLITEQNEDALFGLDAGAGDNPPHLDIYFKSDVSAGLAKWTILAGNYGDYTLRVLATNDVGAVGLSDAMVVNIDDPNLPTIHNVDCMINSTWQPCSNAQYGDSLQKIRIDATDPQEIPDVRLTLRNIPDDANFVDEQLTFNDPHFIHDTALLISDSGQWRIRVTATDSQGNTAVETITWNIPWGSLTSRLISPTGNITVPKSGSFIVEAALDCRDAECPQPKASLLLNKPVESVYDDGSAETYGEIGGPESHIAVLMTPQSYPAHLQTARFYVWDTTTFPFKLIVWDDDGPGGIPGTQLLPPLTVDPVTPSVPTHEVAWFDVDLSEHNIVIESGSFYIGWQQIGAQNNQVGFDTDGARHSRTWGYHVDLGGWFNLEDWAWIFPELYGNIMIRAVMGEPGSYQGPLPTTLGPAPFYTTGDHPENCADMNAGDECLVSFEVRAVGAAAQSARLHAVAANNYSLDITAPARVTITAPQSPCRAANLDAVGMVDFRDLARLAAQWLRTTPPLYADIHIDQSVDPKDLAQIANYWLQNCE